MHDPFAGDMDFDWDLVPERYDAACRGYRSKIDVVDSEYLSCFDIPPKTDRELYRALRQRIDRNRVLAPSPPLNFDEFRAVIYWKHYSATLRWVPGWLGKEIAKQERNASSLCEMMSRMPTRSERSIEFVVEVCKLVETYTFAPLGGMPTRSTLLHLLFPDAMPIVDKMALRAVGAKNPDKTITQKMFFQFIPEAWELADRHTERLAGRAPFESESGLRVLDMGLWVHRGRMQLVRTRG